MPLKAKVGIRIESVERIVLLTRFFVISGLGIVILKDGMDTTLELVSHNAHNVDVCST